MPVIDRLLSSLIKYLQSKQKARKTKKRKKAKRRPIRSTRSKGKSKPARRYNPKPKKTVAKKTASKKAAEKPVPREDCVGQVTHFFSRIKVIVVKMTGGPLHVGDRIHIKGRGADFVQKVESLQIESVDVKAARRGQLVGLKVKKAVKPGNKVYKQKTK